MGTNVMTLTGTAEGKTIETATDMGGEMVKGLLGSVSISAEQIISMSAQVVRDADRKRYVYTVTLLVRTT